MRVMAEKDGPEPAALAPGARERFMGGPVGVVDGLVPTVYNRMVSFMVLAPCLQACLRDRECDEFESL